MTKPNLKHPGILLATWFGLGLIPKAPGTWGSIGAIPPAIALFHFTSIEIFTLAIIIITIIGLWASAQYESQSNTHDAKQIVIDEVAGQWIALLPALYFTGITPLSIATAFILFRLFDITKPWPISYIDKNISGAKGVMFDDILAGIFAAIVMIGLIHAGLR